jgi:acyl-CoA reductase-like NAD-dependent aldehyde dehydrogenase
MTRLHSYDPATGEVVGSVTVTPAEDVAAVVAAARRAQPAWAALGRDARAEQVARASQAAAARVHELAELICREMGKDLGRARSEAGGVTQGAGHLARAAAQALAPERRRSAVVDYRPLGVAAVISPWNYPLAMASNLLVPALIAGNTVVLKPSEETPLVADLWVRCLNTVLPSGVLTVVHGGPDQGRALVDAGVDVIGFTGSMAVGTDIMRRAAPHLTRLVMELGGNDPMIVTADADVVHAARFAVASSFENAGQMCTSTERIYVDARVAEAFEAAVVREASRYRVGPWDDPSSQIGPLVNARQRSRVLDHVADAVERGATVLLGGEGHPERYVVPTVLTGVPDDARMAREETFGPIVAIRRVVDTDEAVRLANDSPYGLGAVVFGGDDARDVADRLEAGMVGIGTSPGGGYDTPWVGARKSGYGFHGSAAGYRQFAQVRVTRG